LLLLVDDSILGYVVYVRVLLYSGSPSWMCANSDPPYTSLLTTPWLPTDYYVPTQNSLFYSCLRNLPEKRRNKTPLIAPPSHYVPWRPGLADTSLSLFIVCLMCTSHCEFRKRLSSVQFYHLLTFRIVTE
jgi:hypothetical protein